MPIVAQIVLGMVLFGIAFFMFGPLFVACIKVCSDIWNDRL
jgi:hypothetical protein